jgi:hypothetical protein
MTCKFINIKIKVKPHQKSITSSEELLPDSYSGLRVGNCNYSGSESVVSNDVYLISLLVISCTKSLSLPYDKTVASAVMYLKYA